MVKAELSYNPYLLETKIKFNGQEPKINSLVEKYQAVELQAWIGRLPDIFYHEMNGWNFDLDFSGTLRDYKDLQRAFDDAGISRDSVRLSHKKELECVRRKCVEISDLLQWFESNPNDKFPFDDFRQTNASVLKADCSLVIVQGPTNVPISDQVIVENVPTVCELAEVALDHTPVLFYINEQNLSAFRKNLTDILKRFDISRHQLFFCVSPDLNRSQIERIIRDLGVYRPLFVESSSAEMIQRYFDVYPMTAYVQQVIDVLRKVQSEIGAVLQAENEQSIITNADVLREIDRLDETLLRLKTADEKISQRGNFASPSELSAAKDSFLLKIYNWRKRRIKMTTDEEALRLAAEFESNIYTYFGEFISQVSAIFQAAVSEIDFNFFSIYRSAEFNNGYKAKQENGLDLSGYALPELAPSFLELKSEKYVAQGDSPFERIKGILGNPSIDPKQLVRVVTYIYQVWREKAETLTLPVVDNVLQYIEDVLTDYYERTAQDYHEVLKALIEEQAQRKEEVTAQLSDDERKLQEDNDWFSLFQEKLHEIERN